MLRKANDDEGLVELVRLCGGDTGGYGGGGGVYVSAAAGTGVGAAGGADEPHAHPSSTPTQQLPTSRTRRLQQRSDEWGTGEGGRRRRKWSAGSRKLRGGAAAAEERTGGANGAAPTGHHQQQRRAAGQIRTAFRTPRRSLCPCIVPRGRGSKQGGAGPACLLALPVSLGSAAACSRELFPPSLPCSPPSSLPRSSLLCFVASASAPALQF